MYDYSACTDEELILRLRDGEEAIMDYIMDKYKNLVRKYARNMYILGAEEQDLIQEGMIGLFRAIKDYDCGRDASFFTFADLCISRKMYNAIEASKREKHTPAMKRITKKAKQSLWICFRQEKSAILRIFLLTRKMWRELRILWSRNSVRLKNRFLICI